MKDLSGWGAVIAAGGEAEADVAHASGIPIKGLVEFAGKPSALHVLDACRDAGIGRISLVAGPEISGRVSLKAGETTAAPGDTGFASIYNGVLALESSNNLPILFLPSDTPMVTGEDIRTFIAAVSERLPSLEGKWFGVGLCPEAEIVRTCPGAEFRYLPLREGRYASGALYSASQEGFHSALSFIEAGNRNRKSALKLAWRLGLVNLIRFSLGRISLSEAEKVLSRFLGGPIVIVPDCDPRTTLDFDSAKDYEYLAANFDLLATR